MAAAPVKPWEKPGVNCNTLNYTSNFSKGFGNQLINDASLPGIGNFGNALPNTRPINPPALPPRPGAYSGYNNYGNPPFGAGYGYSQMSSMYNSPYSLYNGYGGMNRLGYSNFGAYGGPMQNSFIQMAEENSRSAFQSIETIVQAVGSVSMMLESTYSAMYSSFRAVLGVIHHFSHMKTQISQVLSALAIVRSLRWLYRKVLFMLGIRNINPTDEYIWSKVASNLTETNLTESELKQRRNTWPVIIFFAVVFGGPWLIWKLIASVSGNGEAVSQKWMTGEGPHYTAVALYNFRGESQNELSFAAKQTLHVAPKELQPRVKGWLLASVDGKTSGLVPGNYVQILVPQPTAPQPAQSVPLDVVNTKKESEINQSESPEKAQNSTDEL